MSLMPPNATTLERRAAEALAAAMQLHVPLRELHNPDTCPAEYLPYLAWRRSVDRWDEAWSEKTKRSVIKQSFFVHSHKGTPGAIRRAVEPFGYVIRVVEWYNDTPPAQPGTFRLDVGVLESGITDEIHEAMTQFIDDAKAASRHLTELAIHLETRGVTHVSAAVMDGDYLTVYPPVMTTITAHIQTDAHAATHIIDTMSIYP